MRLFTVSLCRCPETAVFFKKPQLHRTVICVPSKAVFILPTHSAQASSLCVSMHAQRKPVQTCTAPSRHVQRPSQHVQRPSCCDTRIPEMHGLSARASPLALSQTHASRACHTLPFCAEHPYQGDPTWSHTNAYHCWCKVQRQCPVCASLAHPIRFAC